MREIAAATLILGLFCCGDAADAFVDYYRAESQEQRIMTMRGAPVIIVGTVQRVQMVGQPKPAARVPDLSLQLYKAVVDVEMVVRGDADRTLEFSFFGPDPRDGLFGLPKYYVRPEQRRVFFLKREDEGYRAVGDYLDYSEPVYSGKPDVTQVQDRDSDRAIARILLTPSRHLRDKTMFASTLFNSAGRAQSFVTPAFVQDLLEKLVMYRDPDVRKQACKNLKIHHKRSTVCSSESP